MVNIQVVLYCVFYCELIIDGITQIGCVDCINAGIDLIDNVFSRALALGPPQPAVVFL